MEYLQLGVMALVPVILSMLFFFLEKRTKFADWNYALKQIIIGVVFGLSACAASQFGVPAETGALMNARGASPLTAALLFGGPAGIIAGVIGGIYRVLCVSWGVGSYTVVACSVATVLAGFIGAASRKLLAGNKRIGWLYGFFLSTSTETLHMLLAFLTHMDDVETVFSVIKTVCLPMIIFNGLSVLTSMLLIDIFTRRMKKGKKYKPQITARFSIPFFAVILLITIIAGSFTSVIQKSISNNNTVTLLTNSINDVISDCSTMVDEEFCELAQSIAETVSVSAENSLTKLKEDNSLTEIILFTKDGKITATTNPNRTDMIIDAEIAEKIKSSDCFTLEYRNNENVKYTVAKINSNFYLAIGSGYGKIMNCISEIAPKVARNRHVGNNGSIYILNSDHQLVSSLYTDVTDAWIEQYNSYFDSLNSEKTTVITDVDSQIEYYGMAKEKLGYKIIAVVPVSEMEFSKEVSIYISSFMLVVAFTAIFVMTYLLVNSVIVKNIVKTNKALKKITNGELDTVIDVAGTYEFESLSDGINTTVESMKKLIAEAEEKRRNELEYAKTIQYSCLPSADNPFPNRPEFDIFATMDTAKEVGGDFYDFFFIDADRLVFLIADVSGKGIPAALFMMTAKSCIKNNIKQNIKLSASIAMANDRLCEENGAELFVTCWIACLNTKTGELNFVNAGHNPPVLKRANGEVQYITNRSGLVLAGMSGVPYREHTINLNKGDELYLYTDGVTEATNSEENLYGEDRLLEQIKSVEINSCKDRCKQIKADIDEFVGDAPQFDDITMLSIKLN